MYKKLHKVSAKMSDMICKVKSLSGQVIHRAGAYPTFLGIKQLQVVLSINVLLPPGRNASPLQVYSLPPALNLQVACPFTLQS